jgi:hypothetical protein
MHPNLTLRWPKKPRFNNGMTWLNGLWAGGKSGHSDFATIAYELQLLVRLVADYRGSNRGGDEVGGLSCCPVAIRTQH